MEDGGNPTFARPPENLVGKDPEDFTPEEEAQFKAFCDRLFDALNDPDTHDIEEFV